MTEDATLGGVVKRYARVGAAMGGLAARMAGERYLGIEVDRSRHAAELTAALGGLKGPLMKVAQIAAGIPDAIPPEYSAAFAGLQADAPPMGWPFVKRRMAAELGVDWQSRFQNFEHAAARAASLGQVHRATGPDGRALACKLQYPEMQSAVDADLAQLKLALGLFERYDGSISTADIHAELSERLHEELDYSREARHMALFRRMLAGEAGSIHVPEHVPELSTRRLLTMNWLEGEGILSHVERSDAGTRNQLALRMFRAWYVPFYRYGVIHGDPHFGNYTIRPDDSVNLLDFGCIRVFPAKFVRGVIDLYRALQRNDEALAVSAYESWGFTDLSRDMIDVLNLWARFLYGPLLEDRTRAIGETASGGSYGREVAHKMHGELRRLGGVRPPRGFVLMDRAAVGLGSLFLRLGAEVNWHTLLNDLIGDFDEAALAQRQQSLLREVGLESAA